MTYNEAFQKVLFQYKQKGLTFLRHTDNPYDSCIFVDKNGKYFFEHDINIDMEMEEVIKDTIIKDITGFKAYICYNNLTAENNKRLLEVLYQHGQCLNDEFCIYKIKNQYFIVECGWVYQIIAKDEI